MNTRIHCSERRVCESVFTEHLICEKFSKEITFELEQPLRAEVERSTQWNEKFSRQKSLFAGVEEESKRREKSLVSKSEKSLFVFHLSWGGGVGGGKQKENADENIFIFSCRSWWNVAGALTWKLSEKLWKLSLWKFSYFSLGIFPALFLSFLSSLSRASDLSREINFHRQSVPRGWRRKLSVKNREKVVVREKKSSRSNRRHNLCEQKIGQHVDEGGRGCSFHDT